VDPNTLVLAVAWFGAFLFSSCLHEAAHGFAALKLGDPTAYHSGQVTLDPLPHLRREPVGMVLVPVISFFAAGWMFGWASCPYDPHWANREPRKAAWMSAAGPASNLLLVILAALGIRIGLAAGSFTPPDHIELSRIAVASTEGLAEALAMLLSVFFALNLILFCFNLLPLPPLDGSGLLPLILRPETARRVQNFLHQPGVGLFGLFVAWQVFGSLFSPIFIRALNILYFGVTSYS
jgi:Zn-dependent protease